MARTMLKQSVLLFLTFSIQPCILAMKLVPAQVQRCSAHINHLYQDTIDTRLLEITKHPDSYQIIKNPAVSELNLEFQAKRLNEIMEWIRIIHQTLSESQKENWLLKKEIKQLNDDMHHTKCAIKKYEHKDLINALNKNPLEIIIEYAQKSSYESMIDLIHPIYPFNKINQAYKKNTGKTLIHALCDAKIFQEDFSVLLRIFNADNICINDHCSQGQTALDYLSAKNPQSPLIQILVRENAQNALPVQVIIQKKKNVSKKVQFNGVKKI